jgi:hypothetical protein
VFCRNQEKEKTNGDLKTVSKISKMQYGDILCARLARDVEKKDLSMVAEIDCKGAKKMVETGLKFPQKLTCKDGKFVI